MYVKILELAEQGKQLCVLCNYFVAPIGEEVFAILGVDRILYIPIDSDLGKEYALRIVKKTGWNVKKVKVRKMQKGAVYSVPKSFGMYLNLKKGDYVLAVGKDDLLEIIPIKIVIEKIGSFKEPSLL